MITLCAGTGIGWWARKLSFGPSLDAPGPVRRFEIDIGRALPMYDWSIVSEFALSPDGTHLAYVARTGAARQLHFRRLDEVQATAMPGTEHALAPFFSPEGQWIADYSADSMLCPAPRESSARVSNRCSFRG